MTKREMIKELVKEWIGASYNGHIKTQRFIHHDTVENYLDRNLYKDVIELIYNRVFKEKQDINYQIEYYTNSKFIY